MKDGYTSSASGGRIVDVHYPTIDEPATPDYVLAVLRDMHRQQCQHDPEADPSAVLSFDTTVTEWRAACDLLGWRQLIAKRRGLRPGDRRLDRRH